MGYCYILHYEDYHIHTTKKVMEFIDLFAGIGGFRLGLERAGHKCVFGSEIDKSAATNYHRNFGVYPSGDITKIKANEIPPHEIICGGFPCQSFSIAGKKLGMLEQRGNLFYEIIRIAKHHNTPILILENVPNLTRMEHYKIIIQEIKNLGYEVRDLLLNAKDYGIPQQRTRLFIIATKKGYTFTNRSQHIPYKYITDIAEDVKASKEYTDIHILKPIPATKHPSTLRIGHRHQGKQSQRIYHEFGLSPTLVASGGELYAFNNGGKLLIRRITTTEAKSIMGFPTFYYANKRQLGNSVIPQIIESIGRNIKTPNELL